METNIIDVYQNIKLQEGYDFSTVYRGSSSH